MKKVYQIVFNDGTGDCFRACVASIFELSIEEVPNFWEQTQNVDDFWELNDKWISDNMGFRAITFRFIEEDKHLTDGILCIACAKSPRGNGKVDHAVVWRDGIVHDPHPSGVGLAEAPGAFTLFIPLDPGGCWVQ
jgi:hypothetical protein